MRILLVNKFFYHKGGAETYFFALAEGLQALGHEVAFFSMQHPENEPSYWSKYFVSEKDYGIRVCKVFMGFCYDSDACSLRFPLWNVG